MFVTKRVACLAGCSFQTLAGIKLTVLTLVEMLVTVATVFVLVFVFVEVTPSVFLE